MLSVDGDGDEVLGRKVGHKGNRVVSVTVVGHTEDLAEIWARRGDGGMQAPPPLVQGFPLESLVRTSRVAISRGLIVRFTSPRLVATEC